MTLRKYYLCSLVTVRCWPFANSMQRGKKFSMKITTADGERDVREKAAIKHSRRTSVLPIAFCTLELLFGFGADCWCWCGDQCALQTPSWSWFFRLNSIYVCVWCCGIPCRIILFRLSRTVDICWTGRRE